MKRGDFLLAVAGLALAGAARGGDISIPIDVRGGRFFAVPRTTAGRVFACWLDTSGSGFIFDSVVRNFALTTYTSGAKHLAELPRFDPSVTIPAPVVPGLPIFERDASDRADPILQGFEAQLGRTWFEQRVWRFDFARGSLTMLAAAPHELMRSGVPLVFQGGYPYLRAQIANLGEFLMSFDTAASVAYAPRYSDGVALQATSFIRRARFREWHRAYPSWQVDREVATIPGIDRIIVPLVRVGTATFSNVTFTTRPNDDVFEGTPQVDGKLGASAYAKFTVLADYPRKRIAFLA